MVRMPLRGSAVLDEVREAIGLRPGGPAVSWPTPGQPEPGTPVSHSDIVWREGAPGGSLSRGMRPIAGVLTAVSSGVALSHQVLAGALAGAHDVGLFRAAAAFLAWPVPLLQPVLAGAGTVLLCAVGVITGGWRRLGPRQAWLLAGAAVAAALGAGPMVLVCALIAVVCVLAVLAGLAILFCLLALLSR